MVNDWEICSALAFNRQIMQHRPEKTESNKSHQLNEERHQQDKEQKATYCLIKVHNLPERNLPPRGTSTICNY